MCKSMSLQGRAERQLKGDWQPSAACGEREHQLGVCKGESIKNSLVPLRQSRVVEASARSGGKCFSVPSLAACRPAGLIFIIIVCAATCDSCLHPLVCAENQLSMAVSRRSC